MTVEVDELRSLWPPFTLVSGTVYAVKPFGAFVDFGAVVPGLLEFIDSGLYEDEDLQIGCQVEAVVAGFVTGVPEVRLCACPEHLMRASEPIRVPSHLRGRPMLFRAIEDREPPNS